MPHESPRWAAPSPSSMTGARGVPVEEGATALGCGGCPRVQQGQGHPLLPGLVIESLVAD